MEVAINDFPIDGRSGGSGGRSGGLEHLDSSEHRMSLPLFVSEMSGIDANPKTPARKAHEAARATWLQNGENTSSVQAEFLDINLYENQMLLLDRAFTSPLHDRGNVHYRYYILDTLDHQNHPCFHLAFVPRRRGELTFEGEMWIDTLTLGLKHVEAKISEGANVNFVRNYTWSQTYERLDDRWVLSREENLADISLRKAGWASTATKKSSTPTLKSPRAGPIRCGQAPGHQLCQGIQ